MSAAKIVVDAILFDMDGTLIDSTAGVVGAWELFKQKYPGIDVTNILSSAHGIRTVDNLRNYCGVSEDELQAETHRFELAIVETSTQNGRQGIILLPGAKDIIEALPSKLPKPSFAICTSATRLYATKALQIAGIELPDVFVTADDVTQGKPAPDPYLLGAKLAGVLPQNCLVVEDAPAGIRSGFAAGCKTLALLTTHSRSSIEAATPDFIVQDLTSVQMRALVEGGVEVTLTQA